MTAHLAPFRLHGDEREDWRAIPGFPGYFASSLGRIRSDRPWNGTPSRYVSATVHPTSGYPRVRIVSPDGMRTKYVHVLVAAAFHGPRPEGQVTRHLDGNKLHSQPHNLAYGTYQENAMDEVHSGRHPNLHKTHCPQGHPYDEANTKWKSGRRRECRTCHRAKAAVRRAAKRTAALLGGAR